MAERLIRAVAPAALAGSVLAVGAFALTAGASPLFEATARLEAASPLLLREYTAAVAEKPRIKPGRPLGLPDLGNLALARHDALVREETLARDLAGISIRLAPDQGEIEIVVRARDPRVSARLANAFAQALIGRRNSLLAQRIKEKRDLLAVLRLLSLRDPTARAHLARAREDVRRLARLRSLPGGGLSISREAVVPRERAAPHVARDVFLAGLLGVLVGFTPRIGGTSWSALLRRARRLGRAIPSGHDASRQAS